MIKTFNGKEYNIVGLFVARNYHSGTMDSRPWALFYAIAPGTGIPEDCGSYAEAKKALHRVKNETGLPIVETVSTYGGI